VEVGGGGEPRKWWVFPCVEDNTARRSHLRPIWALDITNSSQLDGQAFWPVVWQFSAGWILVYSHHCHLKTTWALEHIRQAWENSPKISRPVNHQQWYTHGSLVHWCSNWLVVKSVPCHLVWTRPFLQIWSHTQTHTDTHTHIYIYTPPCGQIKVSHCGITWIYHEQLLSSPGYTPDVCGLFIKSHKNKLDECFNVYGVAKGEQINVLHRHHDRLAVF